MRCTIGPLAIATFSLLVLIIVSDDVELQDVGVWMASAYAWTAVFATFKVMSDSSAARKRSAENEGVLGCELSWSITVLLAGVCMGYFMLSDTQLLYWNITIRGVTSGVQWTTFFRSSVSSIFQNLSRTMADNLIT